MAKNSVRIAGANPPATRSQIWKTPKEEIYDPLDEQFNFAFDLAADDENFLADLYLTEKENALSFEWTIDSLIERCKLNTQDCTSKGNGYHGYHNTAWCNPPYNDLDPWIEQMLKGAKNGITIVALLPNNTDRPWFRFGILQSKNVEHYFYGGVEVIRTWESGKKKGRPVYKNRISFGDPTADERDAPGKGNILAIFRPPLPSCWHKGK